MSNKNINKSTPKYEFVEDIKLINLWRQSGID